MTEDEAEELVRVAAKAADAIDRAIRAEVDAATAQIKDAYAEKLATATGAVRDAKAVLRDVKDQVPDHPWTGKRVFKMVWAPGQHSWTRDPKSARIEGLVETVRSTTAFPGNVGSYSRPRVGSPLVRLLNKDGSPGLRFDSMGGDYHGWQLAEETANAD